MNFNFKFSQYNSSRMVTVHNLPLLEPIIQKNCMFDRCFVIPISLRKSKSTLWTVHWCENGSIRKTMLSMVAIPRTSHNNELNVFIRIMMNTDINISKLSLFQQLLVDQFLMIVNFSHSCMNKFMYLFSFVYCFEWFRSWVKIILEMRIEILRMKCSQVTKSNNLVL